MTVEWKDGKPITTPEIVNGCLVFRTSWEDQQRIAQWNWKAVNLIYGELLKRREAK
jgi:hypothetical protein